MSAREKCNLILDTFDEAQLVNAAALLAVMRKTIDDLEDEAFCEKMMQDYENDPGKGDPMPIEDFAEQLGIVL
ncbi:MAG: hypothetical protein IJ617_00615 [Oscillospiraceae bacterium]|nr:hypothetical protein [Oscillospiraceae bacterium]